MLIELAEAIHATMHSLKDAKALKSITIEVADRDAIIDMQRQLSHDFADMNGLPTSTPHPGVHNIVIRGIEVKLKEATK